MIIRLAICASLLSCGGARGPKSSSHHADSESNSDSALVGHSKLEELIATGQASAALQVAAQLERRGQDISDETLGKLSQLVDRIPSGKLPSLEPSLAASLVLLRRSLLALHAGDSDSAERYAQEAGQDPRLRQEWQGVLARLRDRPNTIDTHKIAVLLPLSGDHAAIGRAFLDGISVAALSDENVNLLILDTQGSEEGAREAVVRAAKAGCLLAIGPIGKYESAAAAFEARVQRLPIAVLAPTAGYADSKNVFRLVLSPAFEAEQAAIVATELGFQSLAVLAPRDELGLLQANAFAASARSLGVEVVMLGTYDPAAIDLENDVRAFLNLNPKTNKRLRQHYRQYGRRSWKSFSPDIEFDLLYIPDRTARAALVASYLPYFNVELESRDSVSPLSLRQKHGGRIPRIVQLMGSGAWLGGDLAARGGAAVEGALIVSACPGGLELDVSEQAREFRNEFRKHIGRPPPSASAHAYDAMTMVLAAHRRSLSGGGSGSRTGQELRAAILRDGVCGTLEVNGLGQVEGQIEVLRVLAGVPEIYEF
ncbi:MAG: penicillin-binding protein activator [Kofleriaceae bacterium]|nr:penicillin-binding protein activator [Kofleriaceae bacterium]